MTSAPKSKPASTKLRYWRVSVPGGKRPEYVGIVEAPDQQSAEATAVKQFRLTDEERGRLVVRARGSPLWSACEATPVGASRCGPRTRHKPASIQKRDGHRGRLRHTRSHSTNL